MTKKIYITRHGQTDYNLKGIVQGSGIDADLNETGIAQGLAFYDRFKDHPFDKLYISALKRTAQSMKGFIDAGIDYEVIPELNEISWGDREGVPIDERNEQYYQQMIKNWQDGHTDMGIAGGESPDEVAARLKVGMEKIMENTDEQEILICMHGRSMRVLLTVLLNYPVSTMDLFPHKNLCLYELTYTGSMFRLDKANDTSHLDHL